MSGTKLDKGKAPISLIPREALLEEAKALDFGAKKYGRYNFREGIEYSRLIDAALRHILALADGEDIDEESGCNHAGNARANLGMLLYMMEKHPEKDDRYKANKLPFKVVADPNMPENSFAWIQTYSNPLPNYKMSTPIPVSEDSVQCECDLCKSSL